MIKEFQDVIDALKRAEQHVKEAQATQRQLDDVRELTRSMVKDMQKALREKDGEGYLKEAVHYLFTMAFFFDFADIDRESGAMHLKDLQE